MALTLVALLWVACGSGPVAGVPDAGGDAGNPSCACAIDQLCLRRHSGIDGGAGLADLGCVARPACPTLTCSGCAQLDGLCHPTACFAVTDGGTVLECFGQ